MALVTPVIFQIVGFQNSGKTTVILQLIEALTRRNRKTVTIKHHGHGGKPNVFSEKDSSRHIDAGAAASIVEGEGRLLLQVENTVTPLEKQIELLKSLQPDVILIEGHKYQHYPKLLILRDKAGLSLLETMQNVKMVLYWDEAIKPILDQQKEIINFSIHDKTAVNKIAELLIKET
ncbi:molybdopterin-guanine dinucleotide biosynthesis protein B [Bacillus salipaludis]|uniref:molybdopterin-guanine dinucleotide biosynthesis protein B n=1 Tax=Bacillus salipaludis TaxID=2547811 RepID=UPI003D1D6896